MNEQNKKNIIMDIDILGSVEFDLTKAIKDLIWNIKTIKKDIDLIKEQLNLSEDNQK